MANVRIYLVHLSVSIQTHSKFNVPLSTVMCCRPRVREAWALAKGNEEAQELDQRGYRHRIQLLRAVNGLRFFEVERLNAFAFEDFAERATEHRTWMAHRFLLNPFPM